MGFTSLSPRNKRGFLTALGSPKLHFSGNQAAHLYYCGQPLFTRESESNPSSSGGNAEVIDTDGPPDNALIGDVVDEKSVLEGSEAVKSELDTAASTGPGCPSAEDVIEEGCPAGWTCALCTFMNEDEADSCEVCMHPKGTTATIIEAAGGEDLNPLVMVTDADGNWSCTQCTLFNPDTLNECEACGAERQVVRTIKPRPPSSLTGAGISPALRSFDSEWKSPSVKLSEDDMLASFNSQGYVLANCTMNSGVWEWEIILEKETKVILKIYAVLKSNFLQRKSVN